MCSSWSRLARAVFNKQISDLVIGDALPKISETTAAFPKTIKRHYSRRETIEITADFVGVQPVAGGQGMGAGHCASANKIKGVITYIAGEGDAEHGPNHDIS